MPVRIVLVGLVDRRWWWTRFFNFWHTNLVADEKIGLAQFTALAQIGS
jgi:hypothetical protein